MFEGFAQVWTPLLPARRLGARPLALTLAGEPVVLFRGAGGRIGALIDRCPHRGVALSVGRVDEAGCLACAFHGWRFAADGANRGVPLSPQARVENLGATALPVRVLGELIWVRTAPLAPGDAPPDEPVAPDGLTDPTLARSYGERDWACHWTRAMENMLDSAHLPFVHARTIGKPMRRRMREGSRIAIDWEETPFGGRARAGLDGGQSPAVLSFYRPNMMELAIPVPGRRLRIHAIVIPSTPGRTRLIVVGSRDFARWGALDPLFAWLNGRIADEDRVVVESAGPDETPTLDSEASVGADRATLQFRRYYYETLRSSRA